MLFEVQIESPDLFVVEVDQVNVEFNGAKQSRSRTHSGDDHALRNSRHAAIFNRWSVSSVLSTGEGDEFIGQTGTRVTTSVVCITESWSAGPRVRQPDSRRLSGTIDYMGLSARNTELMRFDWRRRHTNTTSTDATRVSYECECNCLKFTGLPLPIRADQCTDFTRKPGQSRNTRSLP